MRRLIYLIVCLTGVLAAGCYEDKGNYDYVDINEMQVKFTPEAAEYNAEYYSYSYTYRQPAMETLSVTYTAEVAQSISKGDANLEYEWIVTKNNNAGTRDTVRAKELMLEYEPKVKTAYDVRFRVRDTNTGIDLYRSLRMVTEVPFIKSWFVFHGAPGSRMLGAVEYPDRGVDAAVSLDAYEALNGRPAPFSDAVSMMYTAADGYDISSYEHLTFLAPSKFYYMPAFDLVLSARNYATAMPEPGAGLKISYAVTNNSIGYMAILVTEDGQFVHGGPNGFYYKALTDPDLGGYHVDKACLSTERYLTIWDDVNKRFLYYNMAENWYNNWYPGDARPSGIINQAMLTPFPEELIPNGPMNDYQVRWLGQAVTADTESGGFAIAKHQPTGDYWAYMISYGGGKDDEGDGGMFVTRKKLTGMQPSENSCFATSVAFAEQVFYSVGNTLYRYSMVTGENTEIYKAGSGNTITDLQFRLPGNFNEEGDYNFRLGIAVLTGAGRGQLHELTFGQSADVTERVVFDGDFGPIRNIAYSILHRIIR